MANISVAELCFDPDFVDPVTVLRQVERVDNNGIARRALVPIGILASIQSNGDHLDMLPEATRTSGAYECITGFALCEATETTNADIVLWQGMDFIVTSVSRFGNFARGMGHYEAVIEQRPVRSKGDQGTVTWQDGTQSAVWADAGVLVPWIDSRAAQPVSTTLWDDTGQSASWTDGGSDVLWDVKP
jgi:galactose-6-phosphate isomerase